MTPTPIHRRRMLILTAMACITPIAAVAIATPTRLTNFRFGILRTLSEGVFEFVSETRRIPKKMKSTGFRFGVGFDNPSRESIEWYEVMHFPERPKEASGTLQRAGTDSLRSDTFKSDRTSIIDDYWFDEGDPLGKYTLELFVNGAVRYTVDFEVVNDR